MTSYEQLLDTEIQLTDYDLDIVEIPFHNPVHLPFGTIETRPSAWLKLAGWIDGTYGVGAAEGTSLPMQIPLYDDCSTNLAPNIEQILYRISSKSISFREARMAIADSQLGGNFATARMTIETGLLDLITRTSHTTVFETLSGETLVGPLAIPYGKSIAESSYDNITTAGTAAVNNGARRLKFKLSPTNYRAAITGITQLKVLYPDASFMIDANGTFDPENLEHQAILRDVDSLGLMMMEEPVSRAGRLTGLAAHRALREVIDFTTPIALDDSISTYADAQIGLEEGLGDIINIKPGRLGSFLDCIDISDLAKEKGKQIMVGGMFEATPGRTMTLTLAALCIRQGFVIPGDVSLPQERLQGDLVETNLHLDAEHNVVYKPILGWGYQL
jgi:O-succinylbenzoate synthase